MKKLSSRPVRLSSFQVYCVSNDDSYKSNSLTGELVTKSDVHYCAEKEAIDFVAHYLENCDECPYTYLLYKVSKELKNDGITPKSIKLVSVIYGDNDTKQVVID